MPAMTKYFAYQLARIDKHPLKEWAVYRWQDEVLSILWLYNRTGNRALLDLARKLHAAGQRLECAGRQLSVQRKSDWRRRES